MSNQSLNRELPGIFPNPLVKWPKLVFVLILTGLLAFAVTLVAKEIQSLLYSPAERERAEQPRKLVSIRAETAFDGLHMIARFEVEPLISDLENGAAELHTQNPGGNDPTSAANAATLSLASPDAERDEPRFEDIAVVRWKLGNGESSLGRQSNAVYPLPGKHIVEVEALDASGKLIGWDILDIDAQVARNDTTARIADFAVEPEPETNATLSDEPGNHYLTLPAIGSLFAIEGSTRGYKGLTEIDQSFSIAGNAGRYTLLRALKSGYFVFNTVETKANPETGSNEIVKRSYYVFVSPVASKHVDRSDMDWYMTQFNTETTSNCGPTVTAMSIKWAKGVQVPVANVRDMVGWEGDGAVSMTQLQTVLESYNVRTRMFEMSSPDEIFKILDKGHLLAISYNMAGVAPVENPKANLLGQYYADHGGHYLALKGYSLDRKYVIVYDPIPSDWAYNSGRYGDGESMFGRNRYYPVDQLWEALRSRQALEISR